MTLKAITTGKAGGGMDKKALCKTKSCRVLAVVTLILLPRHEAHKASQHGQQFVPLGRLTLLCETGKLLVQKDCLPLSA